MFNSKTNIAIRETHDSAYLNGLYRHSFKLEFALSDESQTLLSHMYQPSIIQPGPGLGNSGGHQVGAAHQRVADILATKHVKHLDHFIEIGPHPCNFSRRALGKIRAHGCTLRGGRDQQRHASAAASVQIRSITPDKLQLANITTRSGLSKERIFLDTQCLASGIDTETFCTGGFGNCLFQAHDAIAVHSLYDVDFAELARGMDNHGVHRIKAYMHFPSEALYVPKWEAHDKGYLYETVEREGKKVLSFGWLGDCAFGYEHDQETWMNYLTKGGFDTPFGFSVLVEKTRFWGSQFELNISRVTAGTSFFYGIPSGLNTMLRIPNYRKMAITGFCKRLIEKNPEDYYIVVDRKKYERVWNFTMVRNESAFTVTTIKAFVRTVLSSVVISGTTYEDKWNITHEEVSDVCLSVYILGRLTKRTESLVIDEALKHMDKLGEEEGWFTCLMRHLVKFGMPDPSHGPKHHSTRTTRALDPTSDNCFHTVLMKHFSDYRVRGNLMEHGEDMEVRYNPFEADYDLDTPVKTTPTLAELQAVQAYETQSSETANVPAPDWTSGFGTPVNAPVQIGCVYSAQEQHLKLVEECAQAAQKYKGEAGKESLVDLLESTKRSLMQRNVTELHLGNMFLLTGVPGGAKTGKVKREIIPVARTSGPVLVICPTKALAVDYETGFATSPSCKAVTTHVAIVHLMKMKVKWGLLIVEEAYTQPMGLINFVASFGPTLLVGDGNQINHVDFSGTGIWNGCSKLADYAKFIPRHHISSTKRCPQDVAAMPFMRRFYPGISSDSKKVNSIQYVGPLFKRATSQALCFTQDQKQQMNAMEGVNALTVHEAQGKTFESVILHYGGTAAEQQLLKKSPNHLVVGVTRHTNDLFIRDVTHSGGAEAGAGDISRMIRDGSPLEEQKTPGEDEPVTVGVNDVVPLSLIADRSNIDLNALVMADKKTAIVVEEQRAIAKSSFTYMPADSSMAAEIIGRRYPAVAPSEYASLEVGNFEVGADAVGLLNLGAFGSEELRESKEHKVHRFIGSQRVHYTRGHHSTFAAKSMMKRLTKKTRNMNPAACEKTASRLAQKVIDEFNWDVGTEFEQTTFMNAVERMHERGQGLKHITENTDWRSEHVAMCKSHLKEQQKPVIGKDPLLTGKAGQAIVAWDKTLNLMVGPWVRKAEQVLFNQSKGKVKLLNGMKEEEVIAILEADAIPGESYIDNDWTEFDSNQNNLTRAIFGKIMEKVGMPPALLAQFMEQMKQRKVASESLLLQVNDKKDSGGPHTLVDNCVYNLAICLDIMVNITRLYIKGDDSLARGLGLGWDMEQIAYYQATCGAQLKPGASGTFVSFLVTESGAAYDLIRIAAKILSRFYTSEEDFKLYQEAINGQFKKLDNTEALNMIRVNALFHDKSTQSIGDFDALLSFINRFARGEVKFAELVQGEPFHRKTEAVLHDFRGARIVGERREAVRESWANNSQRLRMMGKNSAMGFARVSAVLF